MRNDICHTAQNDSLIRNNENAWTELAAKSSLHPISSFAAQVGPAQRTDRAVLAWSGRVATRRCAVGAYANH